MISEVSQLITIPKSNNEYRTDHQPGKFSDRATALLIGAWTAVSTKKYKDIIPGLALLNNILNKKDKEMVYTQVKTIACYGTYQAQPIINGEVYKLKDYPKAKQAAEVVNEIHRLTGNKVVNEILSTDFTEKELKDLHTEALYACMKYNLIPAKKERKVSA